MSLWGLFKNAVDTVLSAPERLARMWINKAVGPYLEDNLQRENFEWALANGKPVAAGNGREGSASDSGTTFVSITNVRLSAARINRSLRQAAETAIGSSWAAAARRAQFVAQSSASKVELPSSLGSDTSTWAELVALGAIEIESVELGSLQMSIPWADLASKSTRITVSDALITVRLIVGLGLNTDASDDRQWSAAQALLRRLHARLQSIRDQRRRSMQSSGEHMTKSGFDLFSKNYQEDLTASLLASLDWEDGVSQNVSGASVQDSLLISDVDGGFQDSSTQDDEGESYGDSLRSTQLEGLLRTIMSLLSFTAERTTVVLSVGSHDENVADDNRSFKEEFSLRLVIDSCDVGSVDASTVMQQPSSGEAKSFEKAFHLGQTSLFLLAEQQSTLLFRMRADPSSPSRAAIDAVLSYAFTTRGDLAEVAIDIASAGIVSANSATDDANGNCQIEVSIERLTPLLAQFGLLKELAAMCRYLRTIHTPTAANSAPSRLEPTSSLLRELAVRLGSVVIRIADDARLILDDVQLQVSQRDRYDFIASCEKILLVARSTAGPLEPIFGIQHSEPAGKNSEQAGCSRISLSVSSRSSFETHEQVQSRVLLELPYSLHGPQHRKSKQSAGILRDGICFVLDPARWTRVFAALSSSQPGDTQTAVDGLVAESWRDLTQVVEDFRSGQPERWALVDSVAHPRVRPGFRTKHTLQSDCSPVQSLYSVRIPLLSISIVCAGLDKIGSRTISALRCEARQVVVTNQAILPDSAGPQSAFDASDESISLVEFETLVAAVECVTAPRTRNSRHLRLLAKIEAKEDSSDRPRVQIKIAGRYRRCQLTPQISFDYQNLFGVKDAQYVRSLDTGSPRLRASLPFLWQRVTWPRPVQVADPTVDAEFLRAFGAERAEIECACVLPLISVFVTPDLIFGIGADIIPSLKEIADAAQRYFLPPDPPPSAIALVLVSERFMMRASPRPGTESATDIESVFVDICAFYGSDPRWNSALRTSSDLLESGSMSLELSARRAGRPPPVVGQYSLACMNFGNFEVSDANHRILARSTPLVSAIDELLVCSDMVLSLGYVAIMLSESIGVEDELRADDHPVSSVVCELTRVSVCTSTEAISAVVTTLRSFSAEDQASTKTPSSSSFSSMSNGIGTNVIVRDASLKFVSSVLTNQELAHAIVLTLAHGHAQILRDGFSLGLGEMAVWLKQNDHFLRNDEVLVNLCAPDLCASQNRSQAQTHLAKKSLVLIAIVSDMLVSAKIVTNRSDDKTEPSLHTQIIVSFPSSVSDFNLEVSPDASGGNTAVLCLRADSLRTLLDITDQLQQEITAQLSYFQYRSQDPMPDSSLVFVRESEPEETVPSVETNSSAHALDILFDETVDSHSVSASMETLFDEFEIMEVPIDSSQLSPAQLAAEHERVFPDLLAGSETMVVALTTDQQLRFVVVLEGGCDWHECQSNQNDRRNRAIEGRNDRVALAVSVSAFKFTQGLYPLPSEDAIACPRGHRAYAPGSRAALECSSVSIMDFVHTSHHRYFLHHQPKNYPGWMMRVLIDSQLRDGTVGTTATKALKVDVAPMRLFVDENTLLFLIDFFSFAPAQDQQSTLPQPASHPSERQTSPVYRHLEMSQIDLLIDYKPKTSFGEGVSDFFVGNYVYLLRIVELVDTTLVLNRVCLTPQSTSIGRTRRAGDLLELGDFFEELAMAWLTHLQSAQVLQSYLGGSRMGQPVHVAFRLGSAVADLVRVPVSEYRASGGSKLSLVKGAASGAGHLASTVTVEVLNLATSAAVGLSKGISKLDKVSAPVRADQPRPRLAPATVIAGSPEAALSGSHRTAEDQHLSRYADQPRTMGDGASQAYEALRDGAAGSYARLSRDGLYGLPGATLATLNGMLVAVSKLTLAGRNVVDGGSAADAAEDKFKSRRSQ